MALAEELLDNISEEQAAEYALSELKPHIVVDEDRNIILPERYKKIASQGDHNMETYTFDCPRFSDGRDMSEMVVYINYIRSDGKTGSYPADNVSIDAQNTDLMHFDWTLLLPATFAEGVLAFLVCVCRTGNDGKIENHWSSRMCREAMITEGMDCHKDTIVDLYPDIITRILERLNVLEDGGTNSVQYTIQDLEEEQKAQARKNIGAAAVAEVSKLSEDIANNIFEYGNDIVIYNNRSLRSIDGTVKLRDENDYFMVCVPVNNYVFAYFNADADNEFIAYLNKDLSYKNKTNAVTYYYGENIYNSIAGSTFKEARKSNVAYLARTFKKETVYINEIDCKGVKLRKTSLKDYGQFVNLETTNNLFDMNCMWHPCEMYGGGVSLRYSESYLCSELMEVTDSETYYSSFYSNDTKDICFAMFENDLSLIDSKIGCDVTDYLNNRGIKFPDGTKYVCIVRRKDYVWQPDRTEPNELDYLSNVCYRKNPERMMPPEKSVPVNKLNGLAEFLFVKPQNTSLYYTDKKFVFEGDSLTADGSGKIYTITTCRELGITKYENTAVGGTSMEGINTGNDGCIVCDDRVNKYPLDTDYIVIMCGTNGENELGELSLSNCDINTFIGAFNVWLSKVYYKFRQSEGYYQNIDYSAITRSETPRDINIIAITPPQGYGAGVAVLEGKLKERGDAMLKMGRLWGVPVLDSMSCMQMNVFNCTNYYGDKTHFGQRSHFMLANGLIGLLRHHEPIKHDETITNMTSI